MAIAGIVKRKKPMSRRTSKTAPHARNEALT
jgi:hypothetical protein